MQNKKYESLIAKSEELDKKIRQETKRKADIQKQIEALKAQEIINFMRDNEIVYNDDFFAMLGLLKNAADSGLTADGIRKILGLNPMKDTGEIE